MLHETWEGRSFNRFSENCHFWDDSGRNFTSLAWGCVPLVSFTEMYVYEGRWNILSRAGRSFWSPPVTHSYQPMQMNKWNNPRHALFLAFCRPKTAHDWMVRIIWRLYRRVGAVLEEAVYELLYSFALLRIHCCQKLCCTENGLSWNTITKDPIHSSVQCSVSRHYYELTLLDFLRDV